MRRVTIYLNEPEHDALFRLAEREQRDPRTQGALLIRKALERRGLLRPQNQPSCDSASQAMKGDSKGK